MTETSIDAPRTGSRPPITTTLRSFGRKKLTFGGGRLTALERVDAALAVVFAVGAATAGTITVRVWERLHK